MIGLTAEATQRPPRPARHTGRLLLWIGGGVLAVLLVGLVAFVTIQPVQVLPRMTLAPAFDLVDQNGNRLTSEDQRGKLTLYSFTYTNCGAGCAQTGPAVQAIQERLKTLDTYDVPVQLVTIAVDPARDTPERIAAYAGEYGADPDVTRWVDNLRIVVVPVVNADGHDVVTSGQDPRWRKNTRDTDGNGILNHPDGIDINRNYDFNWAGGGAGEPASGRYRGPFPFSEYEPRAIADLARSEHFLLSITYHSQGEVIYYPWNWGGRPAPDDALIVSLARSLAGSIPTMKGDTLYRAEPGAALVGQSYPWLYGTMGTIDLIVETGLGAAFFPPHDVQGIIDANLKGIRTMLERAGGPGVAVHVTDAATGAPLPATVWLPRIETEEVRRRTTHPRTGTMYRFLPPGGHQMIISHPGYDTQVLSGVTSPANGWKRIDITLSRTHQ